MLVEAPDDEWGASLKVAARAGSGERMGVMLPEGMIAPWELRRRVYRVGELGGSRDLAQRLYAGLRALDAAGCTVIVCPLPRAEGIGVALRDRLRKAAR